MALIPSTGCERSEKIADTAAVQPATIDLPPDSPPAIVKQVTSRSGPRLSIDSSATEARLEIRSDEYVVHLPPAMARILNDSFPGFAPIPRTSYDRELLAVIDSKPEPVLFSAVLGDFNGDAKKDVAMLGTSAERYLFVMVLANSRVGGQAQLHVLFRTEAEKGTPCCFLNLVRPQRIKAHPSLEREELVLRTDAVQSVVPDKASVIYFLDRGVIKEYTTSD